MASMCQSKKKKLNSTKRQNAADKIDQRLLITQRVDKDQRDIFSGAHEGAIINSVFMMFSN